MTDQQRLRASYVRYLHLFALVLSGAKLDDKTVTGDIDLARCTVLAVADALSARAVIAEAGGSRAVSPRPIDDFLGEMQAHHEAFEASKDAPLPQEEAPDSPLLRALGLLHEAEENARNIRAAHAGWCAIVERLPRELGVVTDRQVREMCSCWVQQTRRLLEEQQRAGVFSPRPATSDKEPGK